MLLRGNMTTCGACRWWHKTGEEIGECRCLPPVVHIRRQVVGGDPAYPGSGETRDVRYTVWPEVTADEWCASGTPKTEER